MAHELKEIRYQSRTYAKLETLINRVNETNIKEAHRRQLHNKAVGVDGIAKAEYGEKLDENIVILALITCLTACEKSSTSNDMDGANY